MVGKRSMLRRVWNGISNVNSAFTNPSTAPVMRARSSSEGPTSRYSSSAVARSGMTLGARPPSISADVQGAGADLRVLRQFHLQQPASARTSFSIADSPRCGYAECAIFPVAVSSTRSAPLEAVAMRLSVGSPLIRSRLPRGCRFAIFAPKLSRSSPTRNSSPARTPASCRRSAAAICAAMIPLASQAPRP